MVKPISNTGDAMQQLLAIMAQLRNPEGGCPWDLKQDFRSILPHTLEEAYEVADAIESDDRMQLRDEFETLRVEYGELLDAAARGVNVSNLSDRLENVILKLERKSAIIARLQRSDR